MKDIPKRAVELRERLRQRQQIGNLRDEEKPSCWKRLWGFLQPFFESLSHIAQVGVLVLAIIGAHYLEIIAQLEGKIKEKEKELTQVSAEVSGAKTTLANMRHTLAEAEEKIRQGTLNNLKYQLYSTCPSYLKSPAEYQIDIMSKPNDALKARNELNRKYVDNAADCLGKIARSNTQGLNKFDQQKIMTQILNAERVFKEKGLHIISDANESVRPLTDRYRTISNEITSKVSAEKNERKQREIILEYENAKLEIVKKQIKIQYEALFNIAPLLYEEVGKLKL